jgi:HSP20 family protein
MGVRDLIPWTKGQQLSTGHETFDPFFTLHREMNRLFDDVFRGFGPLGRPGSPLMEGQFGWPRLEFSETDKTVTVSAELPGLRLKSRMAFFRSAARRRPSEATNRNSSASAITDRSNVRYRWRALKKTRPKQISRMAS